MMTKTTVYYCNDYNFNCEDFLHLLPESRVEKYNRLRFEKDKKNCVGAYLLFLYGLREYGVSDFEIGYYPEGKPFIKGDPVYFNISHGDEGFVCALSKKAVGVDIQHIVTPKEAMFKKVCSTKESETVNGKDELFTRLWTLKESIIKKNGETIGSYGKYEFSIISEDFFAYGSHFVSLKKENSVITLCGEFTEYEFKQIKITELF